VCVCVCYSDAQRVSMHKLIKHAHLLPIPVESRLTSPKEQRINQSERKMWCAKLGLESLKQAPLYICVSSCKWNRSAVLLL
jgi:hypothetical protein